MDLQSTIPPAESLPAEEHKITSEQIIPLSGLDVKYAQENIE